MTEKLSDNDKMHLVMDELLKERRKDRFWKNARIGVVLSLFVVAMVVRFTLMPSFGADDDFDSEPYVALVNIDGTITPNNPLASDSGMRSAMYDAFNDENAEGVVIRISSPGGTPVQSEMIRARIERLKERHERSVIVVGEEALASGAYLIAMGGDRIYTQPATIVGSIGVRMSSFGAAGLMDELGLERRIYSAGEDKVSLDPFLPEDQSAVDHTQSILDDIHGQFIEAVQVGRGERLKASPEDLYSGRYWTGSQAMDLGLVDGLAPLSEAIDQEFGTTRVKSYGPHKNLLTRMGFLVESAGKFMSTISGEPQVESVWNP